MDERPTLICCRTVIGFGAPNKQGKESTHGAPLGKDEVAAARAHLELGACAVRDSRRRSAPDGAPATPVIVREEQWQRLFEKYRNAPFRRLAAEFARRLRGDLPQGFSEAASRLMHCEVAEPTARWWLRARPRRWRWKPTARCCRS
jgi:transketolase